MPAITFKPELQILALDPASKCGFAHSNGQSGTWDLGGGDTGARLAVLRTRIFEAAGAWGVKMIAFEESSLGAGSGGGKRKIQWHVIVFHNQLRGVIEQAAVELGVPKQPYNPLTIKAQVAGSGRAKKDQMMRAVKLWTGKTPRDDNEADAIAVLIMADSGFVPVKKAKKKRPAKAKGERQRTFLK